MQGICILLNVYQFILVKCYSALVIYIHDSVNVAVITIVTVINIQEYD